MAEEEKVVSVKEYRSKLTETQQIRVPSGGLFEVRRVLPMEYIKEGLADLPNEFFKFISNLMAGKLPDEKEAESEEAKKNYELFDKFLKVSMEKGTINPPVILRHEKGKEETHLIFSELDVRDQQYILDVITGRISV